MDASASPKVDLDLVCGFFVQIENGKFRPNLKQNNTVIKYTRLPDFDYDPKVPWLRPNYSSPRMRRIVTVDDQKSESQSLKAELGIPLNLLPSSPLKIVSTSYTKRKIVTIAEDDENTLHPKCSMDTNRSRGSQKMNKSVTANFISREPPSPRATKKLTPTAKYSKIQDNSAKINTRNNSRDVTSKPNFRSKFSDVNIVSSTNSVKASKVKEKDTAQKTLQKVNTVSKISVSKNFSPTRESENKCNLNKNKLTDKLSSNVSPTKPIDMSRMCITSSQKIKEKQRKEPLNLKKFATPKTNFVTIHVPRDHSQVDKIEEVLSDTSKTTQECKRATINVDCSTETTICSRDADVGTDPQPQMLDKMTKTETIELNTIGKHDSDKPMDIFKQTFDSLDIPNVTLTKEKSDMPNIVNGSQSLPNLQVGSLKITPQKSEKNCNEKSICKNTSYIIGHATVTYTTRQKINFHVVGNNEDTAPKLSSSPLAYPMNVVSVFKKEIKNREIRDVTALDNTQKEEDMSKAQYSNCLNEIKSLNWSCVFDSSKLVKPSEIISTIRVNNGLLQNDYICEQFQRELNFIDSFFESLQYLESCSLSNKCFTENKVENWVSNSGFNVKNPEYDSFFSKLENGAISDDSETMASKSLCLLNLLIRDEQRRAKNLLFVLKMREDALKDFTKSQILWLENKKKLDNTDISTLKKKQRGALLKLQHECGEMQRMRKALLALSEKRKVALMKTKKNIELKLKNNVSVDQIILGKKKLKRNPASDRNTAPLKCFDLSSSGCDESTSSMPKSDTPLVMAEMTSPISNTKSVEKCIQTGDSLLGTICVDQSTATAAENFVAVDGGYLNILFHNLSLPQIFSSGKSYEVNEEALRNIVNSSNSHKKISDGDTMEKFIEQIKNRDPDLSSTPSTARSLVEELDQYYKDLVEEDKSLIDSADRESPIVNEVSQTEAEPRSVHQFSSISTMTVNETVLNKCTVLSVDESCECENRTVSVETQASPAYDLELPLEPAAAAGPLPVPAGQASECDVINISPLFQPLSTSSTVSFSKCLDSYSTSQSTCPNISISSLSSPAQGEAEELRRQQLAIEREIKALEQQQCQLLVVREIPDKPPPPYTPPNETRAQKPPPMFLPDDSIEQKVLNVITQANESIATEAFDVFVQDFCLEMVDKQISEDSDKPWDACNMLPQKEQSDINKLVIKSSSDLKCILTGVTPTVVSGVGARRSDHIDDILFAEWRRCEPEWTALHIDEAVVKNQVFDSIFQKILNETVDEYKKTVLNL